MSPNESYKRKYQKHAECSFGCKLVCVDDKFSKYFMSYLGKDCCLQLNKFVYNFINSMLEESKCCNDVIKKAFNKKLVMNKKDDEDFKNSVDLYNVYVKSDVKVRGHCYIAAKYRINK